MKKSIDVWETLINVFCQIRRIFSLNGFLVSKETVVLRRWER